MQVPTLDGDDAEDFGGFDDYEIEVRDEARRIAANPLLDQTRAAELRTHYWFLIRLRRSAYVWVDAASDVERNRLLAFEYERAGTPGVTARAVAAAITGTVPTDEQCRAWWLAATAMPLQPTVDVEWFTCAAVLHWEQRTEGSR